MNPEPAGLPDYPRWRPLYQVGAAAALAAVVLFRPHLGAELSLLRSLGLLSFGPDPVEAQEWFRLLQARPVIGLVLLDLCDPVHYALWGLAFLALFIALRGAHRGSLLAAAGALLTGIGLSFAANPAFTLLSLGARYAAAAEGQQAALLSAAQAVLAAGDPAGTYPSTAILACRLLIHLAGLLAAAAMLRAQGFGRGAAVTGLLANGIYLLYFPVLALVPSWVALPPALAAPFRMAWHLLIAIKLLRLAGRQAAG
jgi:hypothetical protein